MVLKNGRQQPVHKNDEITETIAGFGKSGDAFVKFNNFIIFVKGMDGSDKLCVGDKVNVRVTKVSASVGFGKVIK